MNLLHGDHMACWISKGNDVVAVVVSHDVGTPHTTRVKGWAYDSYSDRIIDVLGERISAE